MLSRQSAAVVHRVVLDTVVLVRALINPHSRCGRIVFVHHPQYRLFVSEPVTREMLAVLHRPELTAKFRGLADLNLSRVVELLGQAEVVEAANVPATSRDPNDDKFLATAAAAEADYLVTEDADLLILERHGEVKIVNADAFLQLLGE